MLYKKATLPRKLYSKSTRPTHAAKRKQVKPTSAKPSNIKDKLDLDKLTSAFDRIHVSNKTVYIGSQLWTHSTVYGWLVTYEI